MSKDNISVGSGSPPGPRNYFSRPEQYRLLAMAFSLLTVLFLMLEAGRPENWQWMWGTNGTTANEPPRPTENLDTRYESAASRDDPGSVIIARSSPPTDPTNEDRPDWFEGAAQLDMSSVRDHTVFRGVETETWFELLGMLRQTSNQALAEESAREVGVIQLSRQPAEYRGHLVRLNGAIRRAHYLKAHRNELGIEGYWRCWLFTPGSKNPIVVYSLEMPQGFPSGMELSEAVEFVGVFFKVWVYQAADDIRTAPLVLAKLGDWLPKAPRPPTPLPSVRLVLSVGISLTAIAALFALTVYRSSVRLSEKAANYDRHLKSTESDGVLTELDAGPTTEIFLEKLESQTSEYESRSLASECESTQ